ncbi:hypothetical protein TNCV_690581 [Trichonephila clavipes]|nr:hypothetical protein TNCV_690581 [Trichonephila clavipes]
MNLSIHFPPSKSHSPSANKQILKSCRLGTREDMLHPQGHTRPLTCITQPPDKKRNGHRNHFRSGSSSGTILSEGKKKKKPNSNRHTTQLQQSGLERMVGQICLTSKGYFKGCLDNMPLVWGVFEAARNGVG